MAIRDNYIIDDIQTVLFSLFNKLAGATAPWTSWDVIRGYPETDRFKSFTKPFIYLMTPELTSEIVSLGGLSLGVWEVVIGVWDDRKTGGPEEINIISSRILNLLRNPQTINSQVFDITLGATTTSDTTIIVQGVNVIDVKGPREIFTEDLKEFRNEFNVLLRA